jgi:hypothetical protein
MARKSTNLQPRLFDEPPEKPKSTKPEWKVRDDFPITHDTGAARHTDPPTSKAAAKSVDATDLEGLVINWLRKQPVTVGATAEEMAAGLQMPLNTISPRTAPLQRKKLIYDSGEKRKGVSGRSSIVWKAVTWK